MRRRRLFFLLIPVLALALIVGAVPLLGGIYLESHPR
jgi:hypothetical protein